VFSRVLTEDWALSWHDRIPSSTVSIVVSVLSRPKASIRSLPGLNLHCGIELANGFSSSPSIEQRRLLAAQMAGGPHLSERYPIDDDFIAALRQTPPANGSRSFRSAGDVTAGASASSTSCSCRSRNYERALHAAQDVHLIRDNFNQASAIRSC
jgi:hypothetical protein